MEKGIRECEALNWNGTDWAMTTLWHENQNIASKISWIGVYLISAAGIRMNRIHIIAFFCRYSPRFAFQCPNEKVFIALPFSGVWCFLHSVDLIDELQRFQQNSSHYALKI